MTDRAWVEMGETKNVNDSGVTFKVDAERGRTNDGTIINGGRSEYVGGNYEKGNQW